MTQTLIPSDILYRAVDQPKGEGVELVFPDRESRDRFRWRLFSLLGAEGKLSRKLDLDDPDYGTHPWSGVLIIKKGEATLWVGLQAVGDVTITENVPLNQGD